MAPIVQKYGGSSVADTLEAIKRVAQRIVDAQRGHRVTVVVSHKATRRITCSRIPRRPPSRDNPPDVKWTSSRRRRTHSMALLAMAVNQAPRSAPTARRPALRPTATAQITGHGLERTARAVKDGQVAIVAGFRAFPRRRRITSAAAARHNRCSPSPCSTPTYAKSTLDVDRLFADPRIVPQGPPPAPSPRKKL